MKVIGRLSGKMRATNKRMTDSKVLMSMATAPALMNCRKRP